MDEPLPCYCVGCKKKATKELVYWCSSEHKEKYHELDPNTEVKHRLSIRQIQNRLLKMGREARDRSYNQIPTTKQVSLL